MPGQEPGRKRKEEVTKVSNISDGGPDRSREPEEKGDVDGVHFGNEKKGKKQFSLEKGGKGHFVGNKGTCLRFMVRKGKDSLRETRFVRAPRAEQKEESLGRITYAN